MICNQIYYDTMLETITHIIVHYLLMKILQVSRPALFLVIIYILFHIAHRSLFILHVNNHNRILYVSWQAVLSFILAHYLLVNYLYPYSYCASILIHIAHRYYNPILHVSWQVLMSLILAHYLLINYLYPYSLSLLHNDPYSYCTSKTQSSL